MAVELTTQQVWQEIEKKLFAVLGFVTAEGEARTAGIVYVVDNQKIYIATGNHSWKSRHIRTNPHVSMTVNLPKRIPLLPWINIPDATITFAGVGAVHDPKDVDPDVVHALLHGLETNLELLATMCVIEVQPVDDFITYGVGIPLADMRHPEKARGRAPVS
ncbi:MAG: pyridoxamine 5'-phosphate oxidase family protein [Chloroflexota bacterium]